MRAVFVLLPLLGLLSPAGTVQAASVDDKVVQVCPLDLPGTQGKSSVTSDGIAVSLETSVPSAVAELRARVAKIAELLNRSAAGQGGGGRLPVLVTATYVESEKGASLLLKPKNPADLEKVQTTLANKIEAMNRTKSCYQLASVN